MSFLLLWQVLCQLHALPQVRNLLQKIKCFVYPFKNLYHEINAFRPWLTLIYSVIWPKRFLFLFLLISQFWQFIVNLIKVSKYISIRNPEWLIGNQTAKVIVHSSWDSHSMFSLNIYFVFVCIHCKHSLNFKVYVGCNVI